MSTKINLPPNRRRAEGRLTFCCLTGRYEIGRWELHCGNCFQVKLQEGLWVDTRIEMSEGQWYLVGISNSQHLEGREARSHD